MAVVVRSTNSCFTRALLIGAPMTHGLPRGGCGDFSQRRVGNFCLVSASVGGSMAGIELVREDSLTTSASEDLGTEYAAPVSEPSSASSQETGAQLYCLAVVDAHTGQPRRAATADEARSVARIMARCRPPPPELQEASDADSEPAAEDYAYVTSTPLVRQGGPCRHCGARGEWFRELAGFSMHRPLRVRE